MIYITHYNTKANGGYRYLNAVCNLAIDSLPDESRKMLRRKRIHLHWGCSKDSDCRGTFCRSDGWMYCNGKKSYKTGRNSLVECFVPAGVKGRNAPLLRTASIVLTLVHEFKHLADARAGKRLSHRLPYKQRPHEIAAREVADASCFLLLTNRKHRARLELAAGKHRA